MFKASKYVLIFTSVMASVANAAEGKWTAGSGQGNLEYFIDKSGARLDISCPTQNGSVDSDSSVSLEYKDKAVKAFKITVGGMTFDGPFDATSRVGGNTFITLWDSLRKNDATVTFGDVSIIIPKGNAPQVLPPSNSKEFSCNVDVGTPNKPTASQIIAAPKPVEITSSDWKWVDATNGIKYYANTVTRVIVGTVVQMHSLNEYETPVKLQNGSLLKSTDVLQEYNCSKKLLRMLQIKGYSGSKLTGTALGTTNGPSNWEQVVSGSMGESQFKVACSVKSGTWTTGEPQSNAKNETKNTAESTNRTPDGLTKQEWNQRCIRYAAARSDCATAARVSKCVEIKVGEVEAGMAEIYCSGSTPNFSLMGTK